MALNPAINTITIVYQNDARSLSLFGDDPEEKIRIIQPDEMEIPEKIVGSYDLIIVHPDDWKDLVIKKMMKFKKLPSVLILKERER